MSRILPASVLNSYKSQSDLSVRFNGVDVKLFMLTNREDVAIKSAYSEEAEKIFAIPVSTPVVVTWDPDANFLHRYGIFLEKGSPKPILARFLSDLDIADGSYIKVEMKYKPAIFDVDEFEVVSRRMGKTHDEVFLPVYCLAPRRVKKVESTPSTVARIPRVGAYD